FRSAHGDSLSQGLPRLRRRRAGRYGPPKHFQDPAELWSTMHALIAGAAPQVAGALSEALSRRGHTVALVETAGSALAAVRREPPGLLVLAWRLPGMDPGELCRE